MNKAEKIYSYVEIPPSIACKTVMLSPFNIIRPVKIKSTNYIVAQIKA